LDCEKTDFWSEKKHPVGTPGFIHIFLLSTLRKEGSLVLEGQVFSPISVALSFSLLDGFVALLYLCSLLNEE
jgi:hypothetical protein